MSSAADVLWMSVVRGMRGVGGLCVWLGAAWVETERGEWMRGLDLGFTNPIGTGGVLDVCLCFGCGGVGGEWVWGLDKGLEGWCYVCVSCESGFSVYMAGPGICILCLADVYLFMANPDLFVTAVIAPPLVECRLEPHKIHYRTYTSIVLLV